MAKHIDVAIGILVEKRDAHGWVVLITRRPDETVYGGYWEFPGGKMEPGEAPDACLAREFLEEVGLTIRVGRMLTVLEHHYEHGHVRLHPFFCTRSAGGGEPRNLHVAEHRWVSPEELAEYRFLPANTELLRAVIETLRNAGAKSAAAL